MMTESPVHYCPPSLCCVQDSLHMIPQFISSRLAHIISSSALLVGDLLQRFTASFKGPAPPSDLSSNCRWARAVAAAVEAAGGGAARPRRKASALLGLGAPPLSPCTASRAPRAVIAHITDAASLPALSMEQCDDVRATPAAAPHRTIRGQERETVPDRQRAVERPWWPAELSKFNVRSLGWCTSHSGVNHLPYTSHDVGSLPRVAIYNICSWTLCRDLPL